MSDAALLPVSVVILAHRVDSRFKASLQSVEWANEVLIIWSGSVAFDATYLTPNAQIIQSNAEKMHFAALRNWGLALAQNSWVFFLDSDEVFSPDSLSELQKSIENPILHGVSMIRRDIFLKKRLRHGEVGNIRIVRLVNKQFATFERRVHERAVVSPPISNSKMEIYHFAHGSIGEFLEKITLYIRLEQEERKNSAQQFSLLEMLFFPPAKFCQNYFFRLGFLDGWRGLIYAVMMSIHSFGVRASVYEAHYEN